MRFSKLDADWEQFVYLIRQAVNTENLKKKKQNCCAV